MGLLEEYFGPEAKYCDYCDTPLRADDFYPDIHDDCLAEREGVETMRQEVTCAILALDRALTDYVEERHVGSRRAPQKDEALKLVDKITLALKVLR